MNICTVIYETRGRKDQKRREAVQTKVKRNIAMRSNWVERTVRSLQLEKLVVFLVLRLVGNISPRKITTGQASANFAATV